MSALQPHLPHVLQWYDTYLSASAVDADLDADLDAEDAEDASSGHRGSQSQATWGETAQSPFQRAKERVLALLGRMGTGIALPLVTAAEQPQGAAPAWIAWDFHTHLVFRLPLPDVKPVLRLDVLLPRVVELCIHAGDRQTKTAACELLHSTVLFMLGSDAQQHTAVEGAPAPSQDMAPLWKRVFPVMLRLACDVDTVPHQLFRLLTTQVIHWYTEAHLFESPKTVELLEAILGGLADQENTALRDFCAECASEFFRWSIKRIRKGEDSDKELQRKGPLTSFLLRMRAMALHPSPYQRLGAALAFNHTYRAFREQKALVNYYALDLTFAFLRSLRAAQADEPAFGTIAATSKVLRDLRRILEHEVRAPSHWEPHHHLCGVCARVM